MLLKLTKKNLVDNYKKKKSKDGIKDLTFKKLIALSFSKKNQSINLKDFKKQNKKNQLYIGNNFFNQKYHSIVMPMQTPIKNTLKTFSMFFYLCCLSK